MQPGCPIAHIGGSVCILPDLLHHSAWCFPSDAGAAVKAWRLWRARCPVDATARPWRQDLASPGARPMRLRALWGVDWARWLVAGGVLFCSAPAWRGGERYWWSAWSMRALRRCASSRRVGSSDCELAVIRHGTQDRLQVIGRVGADLKSNADMPGRSGDDQHLEVAVPDDEVPQPARSRCCRAGWRG